jgi:hypothetical protein
MTCGDQYEEDKLMATRRGASIAIKGLMALGLILAIGVTVAGARPALVKATVVPKQTIRQLVSGKFVEKLRCSQKCRATTNLVLSAKVAKQLGFKGVEPNRVYGIALINTRLAAGRWTTVRLSAGGQAMKLLAKSKVPVPIYGVVYARATVGKALKGATGWRTTLRR